jgi:hypothetical protein
MRGISGLAVVTMLPLPVGGGQTQPGFGAEEFGLTQRQLVQSIEQVEDLIAKCMREEGFHYIAADYNTVQAGMKADKAMPGLSEDDCIDKCGFGVAPMYIGLPPQLTTGCRPARVGLGAPNVQIFKGLSPADQIAYNRALLGENLDATFAVGVEIDNFSGCGVCTRKAIEQAFKPGQVKPTSFNPQNAFINNDRRVTAALPGFVAEMEKSGFDYTHPDDVEPDIRARLAALTSGGTILVEKMSSEQRNELKKLQDYERRVAAKTFKFQDEVLGPVEEQIQQQLFSRKVQ